MAKIGFKKGRVDEIMTEFDFDELDKAVSTLMTKNHTPVTSGAASDQSTSSPASLNDHGPSVTTDTPVVKTDTNRPSMVMTRRRGQFMDVKPSAQYPKKTVMGPMSSAPSRKEAKESEVFAAIKEDTIAEEYAESTSPLEEPNVSPFLADAKVEKRPLGMAVLEPLASTQEVEEDEEVPTITNIDRVPANEDFSEPTEVVTEELPNVSLPEELRSDILNVESGTPVVTSISDDVASHTEADPEETPQVEVETVEASEEAPIVISEDEKAEEKPPEPKMPAPVAIKPQYTSTVAEPVEHAPVFDEPPMVVNKPKKKKGWLTVVAIICLMLVSAGAGVGVFLLTNGMI